MPSLPPQTRKKMLVLITGIAAAGALLCWNLALQPSFVQMRAIEAQKMAGRQRESLAKDLRSLQKKVSSYQPFFSPTKEPTWLIEELNRMAEEAGVTLVSAAPVGDEGRASYSKITIRIETQGSYHQLGEFAAHIENFPRLVKIQNARIERPLNPAELRDGVLKAYFSLSVFYPTEGLS